MDLDSRLIDQAELCIQERIIELFRRREDIRKEIEADFLQRGLVHSGFHIGALRDRYCQLLEQHALELAEEITALFAEVDSLTEEGGTWIADRLAKHIGGLGKGFGRYVGGVAEKFVKGMVPDSVITDEFARVAGNIDGKVRLRVKRAVGKAGLRRDTKGSAPRAMIRPEVTIDAIDQRIISALRAMAPAAAESYEQTTRDLATEERTSWRGPATELREALRETLHQLAPDEAVMAQDGFELEKDQTGPTRRQRVRFILRNRASAVVANAEAAVAAAETFVVTLIDRANRSTHGQPERSEVAKLHDLVRVALRDLLGVE